MKILCLHKDGLDRLLRLGAAIEDLTPAGIDDTSYHLVAASADQLEALKELGVDHEDITPRALQPIQRSGSATGFLYCRGGKIPNGTRLRTSYKSRTFEADVRNGKIFLNGRNYDNPSAAARGAGHGSVNGWLIWEYQDSNDGAWRSLEELRAKYAA